LASSNNEDACSREPSQILMIAGMGSELGRQLLSKRGTISKRLDTRGNYHPAGIKLLTVREEEVEAIPVAVERLHEPTIYVRGDVFLYPQTVFDEPS
jgi:hypothetical protein